MGFGVLAGSKASCENPKIPHSPALGRGLGDWENRGFDLVKDLG